MTLQKNKMLWGGTMTGSTTTLSVDENSTVGSTSTTLRRNNSFSSSELANGTTTTDDSDDDDSTTNGFQINDARTEATLPSMVPAEKPLSELQLKHIALFQQVQKLLTELSKHLTKLPPALQESFLTLKQFTLEKETGEKRISLTPTSLDMVDVNSLTTLFNDLAAKRKQHKEKTLKLTDDELYALDLCELQLMRIALLQVDGKNITEVVEKKNYWRIFSKVSVFASIVLGVIYSGAESFTGASDLFGGLLSIAEPITFGISIGFAVLSNLLFFGLEAKGFMVEAGISSPFSITRTVKLAKQKLDLAVAYSQALRCPKDNYPIVNNLALYRANYSLLRAFQSNIKTKLDSLQKPTGFLQEHVYPVLKSIFSISGAALFACGGVIVGKDLVANIAALSFGVALSNPVAMVIIITLAVAGFSLFYALQHRGALDLFDAVTGRPRELIDEQKAFIADTGNIQKNILTNIQNIQSKHRNARMTELNRAAVPDNSWLNTRLLAHVANKNRRGLNFLAPPKPPVETTKPAVASTNKSFLSNWWRTPQPTTVTAPVPKPEPVAPTEPTIILKRRGSV
jgi:hypothetical protein